MRCLGTDLSIPRHYSFFLSGLGRWRGKSRALKYSVDPSKIIPAVVPNRSTQDGSGSPAQSIESPDAQLPCITYKYSVRVPKVQDIGRPRTKLIHSGANTCRFGSLYQHDASGHEAYLAGKCESV